MGTRRIIILFLLASFFALTSCKKDAGRFRVGEDVVFSIASRTDDTKASYSGGVSSDNNYERIDWQIGDRFRIHCAQASDPDEKFSDYEVYSVETPTEGSRESKAHVHLIGDMGLRWGEGDHTFYAVYPSPEYGGITKTMNLNVVTAELPAEQGIVGGISKSSDGNWTAEPDLKYMLMTAKATYNPETGIPEGHVSLDFTPLTTAIKFCIKNDTGNNLSLTDVQIISGKGKTSKEPVLSGAFSVDMDVTGIASGTEIKPFAGNDFTIRYNQAYPKCSSAAPKSTDMADRTLTISVGTDSAPLVILPGKTFTFTFLINPVQHLNDLSFKIIKAGGSWMATRLGYTDGDGIFFPCHKKSSVLGLLVPEGAQWYVGFDGDITPWANGEYEDVSLEYPEIEVDPIMTKWEEGESEEIEMKKTETS